MPGIVGFTACNDSGTDALVTLKEMRTLLTHQEFYGHDKLFTDSRIWATRVHTNAIQTEPQPYEDSSICVWMEGEFYNREFMCQTYGVEAANDPELVAALYVKEGNVKWLPYLDGVFAAVLHDPSREKLHLITDRYGLRQLYWTELNGCLIWASEVKAVLAFSNYLPEIDDEAVEVFFNYGYLLGDLTWFIGVRLLAGATVLTWDYREHQSKSYKYWSWDAIQMLPERFDVNEVIEELGRAFRRAVELRCTTGERLGVTLSGGLDSRAIVAALPNLEKPPHTVTFGKTDSDDVRIASQVARLKGIEHHILEIRREGWLRGRFNGIWWTDGHLNLMHMHSLSALRKMPKWLTINLNGFLGDALLGGSYLGDPRWTTVQKFENRGRRFVNEGGRLGDVFLHYNRLPFLDNRLIELAMAIPAKFRANSQIYNKMLLNTFPEYYQSIPWQKTGLPISYHPYRVKAQQLKWKVFGRLKRTAGISNGQSRKRKRNFVDYENWLRQPPARQIFQEILIDNSSSMYPEFISRRKVRQDWESHLAGQSKADLIGRYLTFEVWLQQVFADKYKDPRKGSR